MRFQKHHNGVNKGCIVNADVRAALKKKLSAKVFPIALRIGFLCDLNQSLRRAGYRACSRSHGFTFCFQFPQAPCETCEPPQVTPTGVT